MLAPLAFLPGLQDRWAWPTLILVVIAAIGSLWAAATGRLPRTILGIAVGILLFLTVAALAGDAPLAQLLGRAPRYEGLLTLPVYLVAAWAAARLVGPVAPMDRLRHAVSALSVGSVLLAFVALVETVGLRPIETDLIRPGSLVGNATDQGIVGAVFAGVLGAVAVGAWQRTRRLPALAASGAVAGVVSVVTSASRAALIALCIVAAVLLIRMVRSSRNRRRDALIAVGSVLTIAAATLVVPLTRERLFGTSAFAQQTIGDRPIMWADAWQIFLSSPWTGVGPSGFADAVTTEFDDGWFERAGVGTILDSPHNIALQVLVAGGILGALSAVAMATAIVAAASSTVRAASGARRDLLVGSSVAMVAAAIALLTHVTSPDTLTLLAVLTGILVASPPRNERPVLRVVATVVGGAWLLMLVAMTTADAALHTGRTAAVRGDLPAATSAFDLAARLRPWDPDAALVAAGSLGAAVQNGLAGAIDEAARWAGRAVALVPGSSSAQYTAGLIASLRGDVPGSLVHLEAAAALSPADPRIHHEYALAAWTDGDLETAATQFARAVELAPESVESARALAAVCADVVPAPAACPP